MKLKINLSSLFLLLILFLFVSCQKTQLQLKEELSQEGIELSAERLVQAAREGDRATLGRMILAGIDKDCVLPNGMTAFHTAAQANQLETLKFLKDQGVNPAAAMPDGRTALHLAAQAGHLEIVRTLLSFSVSANTLDQAGLSPLVDAAAANHREVLQLLMAASKQENSAAMELEKKTERSSSAPSPLTAALENGHEQLALTLLEVYPDFKNFNVHGQSLLSWSLVTNQTIFFLKLLENGADANSLIQTPASELFINKVTNKEVHYYLSKEKNVTILMLASALGKTELVQALLARGARKHEKTMLHKTSAIYLAAVNHHPEIVQILLGKSARPEDQRFRIEVSLSKQKAVIFKDNVPYLKTPISTGKKGFGTPKGTFVITNKYVDWISTLYDAEMPFFMRLSCGPVGLHAGALPGYPASHGCIRLPYENAKAFFGAVDVGTIVRIVD